MVSSMGSQRIGHDWATEKNLYHNLWKQAFVTIVFVTLTLKNT